MSDRECSELNAVRPSLAEALRQAINPALVLRRIVEQALVLLPAAEGSVVEIASHGHLSYVCAAGSLEPHVGTRLEVEGSLSGMSVTTGRTLVCENSATDPRVDGEACRRVGATSMVCVPLRRRSGPVGVLKVISSQPAAFTEGDISVLGRLSEFVTNAVSAATDTSRAVARALGPRGEHRGDASEEDLIAEFIANVMQPGLVADTEARKRVEAALAARTFDIVVQPIFDLATGRMVSAEALARFRGLPYRPPDVWFSEAETAGLGVELELSAVEAAVELLGDLPEAITLAVNVSPQTIASERLIDIVEAAGPSRLVIELTEHLRVEDYPELSRHLEPLRRRGTQLAVDDTGAGISSLTHILKLAPDVIKLDRYLTSGVDIDPVRRALASSLITFAAESGARIVAEGIETPDELATLCSLGVHLGQGYYLGRPGPAHHLDQAVTASQLIADCRAGTIHGPHPVD